MIITNQVDYYSENIFNYNFKKLKKVWYKYKKKNIIKQYFKPYLAKVWKVKKTFIFSKYNLLNENLWYIAKKNIITKPIRCKQISILINTNYIKLKSIVNDNNK